jgi:hypothetical protein
MKSVHTALSSVAVDVFQMSAIETQHEFEAYIPEITPVNQTQCLVSGRTVYSDSVLARSLPADEETAQASHSSVTERARAHRKLS